MLGGWGNSLNTRPGGGQRPVVAAFALCAWLAAAGAASAEERTSFMGIAVEPVSRDYIAAKSVNFRAGPSRKSDKKGALKRGRRVRGVGISGGWIAVTEGGNDLGFVHSDFLMPLIDGTLKKPIEGKAKGTGGRTCDYVVRFEGKNAVEGEAFETSDYSVRFSCRAGGRDVKFPAFMFITEAPYQLGKDPVYQINVDVTEVGGEYEEVLSAIFEYRQDKKAVRFDSAPLKEFSRTPAVKKRSADSIPKALAGAVEMAVGTWNAAAWKKLREIGR